MEYPLNPNGSVSAVAGIVDSIWLRQPSGELIDLKMTQELRQRAEKLTKLPVEHAEGKVVTASDTVTKQLEESGQIAVRYVDDDGRRDTARSVINRYNVCQDLVERHLAGVHEVLAA